MYNSSRYNTVTYNNNRINYITLYSMNQVKNNIVLKTSIFTKLILLLHNIEKYNTNKTSNILNIFINSCHNIFNISNKIGNIYTIFINNSINIINTYNSLYLNLFYKNKNITISKNYKISNIYSYLMNKVFLYTHSDSLKNIYLYMVHYNIDNCIPSLISSIQNIFTMSNKYLLKYQGLYNIYSVLSSKSVHIFKYTKNINISSLVLNKNNSTNLVSKIYNLYNYMMNKNINFSRANTIKSVKGILLCKINMPKTFNIIYTFSKLCYNFSIVSILSSLKEKYNSLDIISFADIYKGLPFIKNRDIDTSKEDKNIYIEASDQDNKY